MQKKHQCQLNFANKRHIGKCSGKFHLISQILSVLVDKKNYRQKWDVKKASIAAKKAVDKNGTQMKIKFGFFGKFGQR